MTKATEPWMPTDLEIHDAWLDATDNLPCDDLGCADCEPIRALIRAAVEKAVAEERRNGNADYVMDLRGIRGDRCPQCDGLGVKAYGSTSTWRGGIGGQTVTTDVCNKCWGSGDADRPWPSWKEKQARHAREIEKARLEAKIEAMQEMEYQCICSAPDDYCPVCAYNDKLRAALAALEVKP